MTTMNIHEEFKHLFPCGFRWKNVGDWPDEDRKRIIPLFIALQQSGPDEAKEWKVMRKYAEEWAEGHLLDLHAKELRRKYGADYYAKVRWVKVRLKSMLETDAEESQ